jgi:hypothetical protein
MFNKAQSFFLDSTTAQNASVVFVTSIELYFKDKPLVGKTQSGSNKPGVTLNICQVKDNNPDVGSADLKTIARVEYDNINTSTGAETSTKFTFDTPVPLKTDKQYAFLIKFDNSETFQLWKNRVDEIDINTGVASKLSSGKVDGNAFDITNGYDVVPLSDVDFKFKVNVAKFTGARSNTFTVSNEAYDFLKLTSGSVSGTFIGGEFVYVQQANLTGTVAVSSGGSNVDGTATSFVADIANNDLVVVANSTVSQVRKVNIVTNTTFMNVTSTFVTSATGVNIRTFEPGTISTNASSNTIVGTNTNFASISSDTFIIISDGTDGNTEVRKVVSVDSVNQQLVLDVVPSFSNSTAGLFISPVGKVDSFKAYGDFLTLYKSSANTTSFFAGSTIIKGVDSLANATVSSVENVNISRFAPYFNVSVPSGSKAKYRVNFANTTYAKSSSNLTEVDIGKNALLSYPATIASRSNEVQNSTNLFANAKSFNATLEFSSDNPFVSPYVLEENLDFGIQQFIINNTSSNEAYSNGAAFSKYVSKPVVLGTDQISEDLIVYLTAFKPAGTDIEVYVKLLSEEDGDNLNQKNWTKLSLDIPTGSSINSLTSNPNDFVELKYVVPTAQSGVKVTNGTFAIPSATNVITGSYGTVNTDISIGSVVKVYNPTFPDTFFVDTVTSSNTTTLTVSKAVSNTDLQGSGLNIDVITDKNSAFRNNQNFNIVRYFNKSLAKYDGFKVFSVKIVLLSSASYLVPRVEEYRAIAVSA